MAGFDDPFGVWSFIAVIESFRRLISVRELAEVLTWSIDSIYREVQDGNLPYVRLRGKIMFDPAALAMHFRRRFPPSAGAVPRVRTGPPPRGPRPAAASTASDRRQRSAEHG